MNSTTRLFTVGHSDRSIDDFLALLGEFGVRTLIDIRAYPTSNRFPHFSEAALRRTMNTAGLEYHWAGRQLGGMRKPSRIDSHPALNSESFRGYAEYMETEGFQKSIDELNRQAFISPTALMCAEKQPTMCHRSLLSDYLVWRNIEVIHIIDVTKQLVHRLNNEARIESMKLVYDRHISGQFNF